MEAIGPYWSQEGPHRGPSWAPKFEGKVNHYDFDPKLGEIEFWLVFYLCFKPSRHFGNDGLIFGIFDLWSFWALEFSGLSAHFSHLDPLFSRFSGFPILDVQDIFSGLDPSSPHWVSMDEPIFKPCGNPVGPIMEINFSKPNYFTQSWVGTFSELPQWALHVFGAHQKGPQAFFLQSPVGPPISPEKDSSSDSQKAKYVIFAHFLIICGQEVVGTVPCCIGIHSH